ncbi:hypothetical protein I6F24_37130, partial [Bradyrhizobium sp. BRP23]|nr:hypothetical protein [Bradyrhizobium sp. BRP23]
DVDGRLGIIDIGPWLGKPESWVQALTQHIGTLAPASEADGPVCGPDGCA